mmetsp:Transcript_20516/g.32650  ORF Transcript_20516/g.32650 Transcript_20516/m.32650 type:complete len:213 (-) Transcript_20516:14-652(-)
MLLSELNDITRHRFQVVVLEHHDTSDPLPDWLRDPREDEEYQTDILVERQVFSRSEILDLWHIVTPRTKHIDAGEDGHGDKEEPARDDAICPEAFRHLDGPHFVGFGGGVRRHEIDDIAQHSKRADAEANDREIRDLQPNNDEHRKSAHIDPHQAEQSNSRRDLQESPADHTSEISVVYKGKLLLFAKLHFLPFFADHLFVIGHDARRQRPE